MHLLLKNLTRKPLRTLLTMLSIAVALFLFCFLEAVLDAFNVGVNMSSASRLVVQHKESLMFSIPIAYRATLEQQEGVNAAVPMVWFGGWYQPKDETGQLREEMFAQFACDLEKHRKIFPEIIVDDKQFAELLADQAGCMIGDKTAERLGIKVGDRIVLRATIWSRPGTPLWDFNVRAIYTSTAPSFDRTVMFFHYKYFDEGRELDKGRVSIFWLGIDDAARYSEIAEAIDRRFANSPYETKSVTEKAFNMQFVSMMGNFQLLLRSIGTAIVLTMLLVAANTMMMNARDQTREMGILKSIGFTDGYIFRLLIGEALVVACLGCVLGAGFAYVLFTLAEVNPKPDFFPVFRVTPEALAGAFGIALITGALSGIVPALAGMRLKATEALRSV
jgi:putative ABC transport system permease protein